MRSRRQGVLDAVSVLGMDPWKDDRVRDFVAINTIQRLRAYHLEAGAPMPPIEDINADRALNLLLLPRAEPDYRPCAGERPQTRPKLLPRRQGKASIQRQPRQHDGEGEEREDGADNMHSGRSTSSASTTSTTSTTFSSSDNDDVDKGSTSTPLNRTPARQPPPGPTSHSPEAKTDTAFSTQCAVDRARAVFFGATSFHASTSPRRLVNSPHVPLTPSVTSTSPIAERQIPHRTALQLPGSTAVAAVATPSPALHTNAHHNATGDGEDGGLRAAPWAASRSLNVDLDAYIEINSTPLRVAPPPPLSPIVATTLAAPLALANESDALQGSDETREDKGDDGGAASSAPSTDADAKDTCLVAASDVALPGKVAKNDIGAGPSPDATPPAIRPTTENAVVSACEDGTDAKQNSEENSSNNGSHHFPDQRGCDVCDAITQYFQSMLTRGVVLDRYNHKDLAFAWWVLGRNMDTAALENRGPMRREALLITIRNMYYGLLSADEARKTANEATAQADVSTDAAYRATVGSEVDEEAEDGVSGRGGTTDEEETAATEPQRPSKGIAALATAAPTPRPRGRGRHPGAISASTPSGTLLEVPASTTAAAARKRPRTGPEDKSPQSDAEKDHRNDGEEGSGDGTSIQLQRPGISANDARVSAIVTRARFKAPTTPSSRDNATADEPSATLEDKPMRRRHTTAERTATAHPLAAALRGDDLRRYGLADFDSVDDAVSESTSVTSSTTASRAGSVTPAGTSSSGGGGGRRRRRAEDRRQAVEETWTSTRTNRRTAPARLAAALEQHDSAAAVGQPPSRRDASRAAAKTSAAGAFTTATELPSVVSAEVASREVASAEGQTAAPVLAGSQRRSSKATIAAVSASTASKAKAKAKAASKRTRSRGGNNDGEEKHDEDAAVAEGAQADEEVGEDVVARPAPLKPQGKTGQQIPAKKTTRSTGKAPQATIGDGTTDAIGGRKGAAEGTTGPSTLKMDKQQPPPPEKKEEHRGRPRGSFKVPRPIVDGVPVATTGSSAYKAGTSAATSASRSGEKKREESSSTSASSPTTFAVAASVPSFPVAATAASDHGGKNLPVPREMPLGLTAHEVAVRARIQHRMGVPLTPPAASAAPSFSSDRTSQTPSEIAAADAPATVYSSYTFLLSSFASNGQSDGAKGSIATTAPVIWYGPVTPPGDRARADEKAEVTAAAPAARLRGRKKKAEGGVNSALLGCALQHDQAALERRVKARLAREASGAASFSSPSSPAYSSHHPPKGSTAEVAHLAECASINGGQECNADGTDVNPLTEVKVEGEEEAESPTTFSGPFPSPLAGEASGRGNGGPAADDLEARVSPPPPLPPAEFAALTYAQQCLLVWTAGELLERHARQRHAAETRRARLLARCGRMATRRMAARVAAAAESSGAIEVIGDAAEQLVKSLAKEEDAEDAVDRSNDPGSERSSDGDDGSEGGEVEKGRGRGRSRGSVPMEKVSAEDTESDSDASSALSREARRKELRPLPRRWYDYWAVYRASGGAAAFAGAPTKQEA
ncbi:hypothetical protein ABB37_09418 [Leptomonas pyrrhocoris]|uniref:Uncharacterized protein n=1 Tax=Leptomonas pyrrhocoris TaxID=157538 RepID=A0A0N0DRA0_LEPPY|nr:hypothetical protein ABB37_09418 [Leptomonas pyrrhocoris]KPA74148.1 hypothetical protein ABB37_09418 [Leptomonas pyrrhocoris]|eukprot:XP_015652587.1 hypothetical protein ABB37_09418 [Leptomonas pyrrhocoris]